MYAQMKYTRLDSRWTSFEIDKPSPNSSPKSVKF